MQKLSSYQGHDISLDERFQFCADGIDGTWPSHDAAKEAIDRNIKEEEAAERRKISVEVLCSDNRTRTLTGIHARIGSLLLKPKLEDAHRYSTYLPCDIVRKAVSERTRLRKELSFVEAILEVFKIKPPVSYQYRQENHSAEMDKLEASVAKMRKFAEESSYEKLLATATPKPELKL